MVAVAPATLDPTTPPTQMARLCVKDQPATRAMGLTLQAVEVLETLSIPPKPLAAHRTTMKSSPRSQHARASKNHITSVGEAQATRLASPRRNTPSSTNSRAYSSESQHTNDGKGLLVKRTEQ
ncbi:hypothetical protein, variant [Exophiala mesophila]|uniref:Uncharacterized protein n=1 Tax=Exophiala mesophila TaxID=212818 RepID=A0A0D1Z8D1_EXOME|nr:uncharacterized protein PV10_07622 [Exophiala mesophila]XP_016221879.1 hypothetical protein, variant [Exophiala mesophila]KIV90304.1 hypothetical protein PV10_07622 [Exophiala mesophila]KIV90305.1 hypothetical protein, variant [Exophiala mesophila]